ncbi:MAG TPA: IclR family transcriptional regulator [Methylomirabilota bacterium]|nr:IclR family transcriptional regulator [Methylomirabilota bacterium]
MISERARLRVEGGHRAANRVVDILELLARNDDGLALREVSAELEAPKSSLLPLLRALAARGYVAQGRAGEYRLGVAAVELGAASAGHRGLAEVARPALLELARRTGETVFLSTLASDAQAVVYVDKVESDQVIRYAAGVGDRRPLHATSSGKAILAFLTPARREDILRTLPLTRHTDRTITALSTLRSALDDVRRAGVALSVDEMVRGASGVAAPVLDRAAVVAGACTIGGPTDRVRRHLRALGSEVKATARAISALLGHQASETRRPAGRLS